jgi:cellulose biosynthesis protein BcsQ
MKVIASYSIKGGVGKTTAAVNLAYLAAESGRRTLLWDLDPQGAASYLFRVKPRVKGGSSRLVRGKRPLEAALKGTDFERLDLLPADFTYRTMDLDLARAASRAKQVPRTLTRLLAELAPEYDVAFLDTPPGASLVSENVLHAAEVVMVPLVPTVLALRTYDQMLGFLDTLDGARPRVRAFFSMVDRRKRLHREIMAEVTADRPGIGAVAVPALSAIELMSVHRAPLASYAPRSAAATAYRELWAELADLIEA